MDNGHSWRRVGFLCWAAAASMSSSRRRRLPSRPVAPSSPTNAIVTHEFKGAATRVLQEATAFGLRRHHVLVEILATFPDRLDQINEERHRRWARATLAALDAMALPGGYPNMLAGDDVVGGSAS